MPWHGRTSSRAKYVSGHTHSRLLDETTGIVWQTVNSERLCATVLFSRCAFCSSIWSSRIRLASLAKLCFPRVTEIGILPTVSVSWCHDQASSLLCQLVSGPLSPSLTGSTPIESSVGTQPDPSHRRIKVSTRSPVVCRLVDTTCRRFRLNLNLAQPEPQPLPSPLIR
jgi:hypothetical protein